MSLILDALNKADRERANRLKTSPSIDSDHKIPQSHARAYLHNKKLLGGLGIALFLIIFFAFYLGKQSAPDTPTRVFTSPKHNVVKNPPEKPPADTQKPIAAPVSVDKQTDRDKVNVDVTYSKFQDRLQQKKIEAEYRKAERFSAALKGTAETPTKDVENTEIKVAQDIASIYKEETNVVQKNNQVASFYQEPEPQKRQTTTLADFPELGTIRDLPWNMQDQIPTLTYMEHNYTEQNASIVINNSRYRNNSKISNELMVEKILEDGIILQFKDKRFKVRALSSWVNL